MNGTLLLFRYSTALTQRDVEFPLTESAGPIAEALGIPATLSAEQQAKADETERLTDEWARAVKACMDGKPSSYEQTSACLKQYPRPR
jgi:hypothetical protein